MINLFNKLLLICCVLVTLPTHAMLPAASIAMYAKNSLVKQAVPLIVFCSFHRVCNVPKDERYKAPFEAERKNFYKQLKAKPWGTVSEKYIKDFQKENRELMRNMCEIFPEMTPVKWQISKFSLYPSFQKAEGRIIDQMTPLRDEHSALLSNTIKGLVQNVGIDPNKIKITFDEQETYNMGAGQKVLVACNYNSLAPVKEEDKIDEIEAIILHEIQHILHDDAFSESYLNFLYQKNKELINEQEFKKFKEKVCHMREKRADIFAGLVRLDYAYALKHRFTIDALYQNEETETHPADSVRAKYLEKLHQEMLKKVQKNSEFKNV